VAGGAILPWTEYNPSYLWGSDQNEVKRINMLEDGADSHPLMSNLHRMVTIPRKLNMDQLQYHLISESQMTQETAVINSSDRAKWKWKKL